MHKPGTPIGESSHWLVYPISVTGFLVVIASLLFLLSGCGEAASCWNDIKGRFTSCEDMRRDEIDRRIDERKQQR